QDHNEAHRPQGHPQDGCEEAHDQAGRCTQDGPEGRTQDHASHRRAEDRTEVDAEVNGSQEHAEDGPQGRAEVDGPQEHAEDGTEVDAQVDGPEGCTQDGPEGCPQVDPPDRRPQGREHRSCCRQRRRSDGLTVVTLQYNPGGATGNRGAFLFGAYGASIHAGVVTWQTEERAAWWSSCMKRSLIRSGAAWR